MLSWDYLLGLQLEMSKRKHREMIIMIVDTLPMFYYEKMIGYMSSSFADLVFAGIRIEVDLRRGKFDYAATASSSNRRPGMSGGN